MKGLLVKDFLLITQKKMFFVLLFVIAIILSFKMDTSFVISYFCMMGTIISTSTISYDEFDNGYPFLLTMPISRKMYATEKYAMAFLCQAFFWIIAVLIQFSVIAIQKTPVVLGELLIQDLLILVVTALFAALMIPIEIKFGAEKGRTFLFLIAGLIFVIGVLGQSFGTAIQTALSFDPAVLIEKMEAIPLGAVAVSLTGIVLVMVAISMFISITVMEKKEL